MDMFGPDFERYNDVQAVADEVETEQEKRDEKAPGKDKTKAKKGKLVAKSTGLTYTFQILESIGISKSYNLLICSFYRPSDLFALPPNHFPVSLYLQLLIGR